MMHAEFKPWTQQKERHRVTHRVREREGGERGKDQQGYSSSNNGRRSLQMLRL